MNVHLQYYAKNVGNIQNDFKRVVEKINRCKDDVGLLQQGQTDQETFNQAILERMREMEMKMKMEGQMERIVSLEEEVATLCWKKACTCGEGKGKGVAVASTSGDQECQRTIFMVFSIFFIPLIQPSLCSNSRTHNFMIYESHDIRTTRQ